MLNMGARDLRLVAPRCDHLDSGAVAMAGGVWLALRGLPPVPHWVALGVAVPLGVALYLGALNIIAPERLAEALNFARNRGGPEPEAAPEPAPAE